MKMKIKFWMPAILFALSSVILTNCKEDAQQKGSFTDSRDGNVYNWVKIGKQVWMAENLHYLPSVVGVGRDSETIPYYYVYRYNGTNVTEAKTTDNYNTYGVLYNWPAACSSCPAGWHLPSFEEWWKLIEYLGWDVAGGKLKETGTTHWKNPNEGATNESGFTALPGGIYNNYEDGEFYFIVETGEWWTATKSPNNLAHYWDLHYAIDDYGHTDNEKSKGYSIRCIKD